MLEKNSEDCISTSDLNLVKQHEALHSMLIELNYIDKSIQLPPGKCENQYCLCNYH